MASGAPTVRVVLVDDEPLANAGLRALLAAQRAVEVVGEATSGRMGARIILERRPDLVFLDVQMPETDGFQVLELVLRGLPPGVAPPEVIFVTAHDQFALRAFEVRALDYLLKPVDDRRFREALGRARERLLTRRSDTEGLIRRLRELLDEHAGQRDGGDRLVVTVGTRSIPVPVATIDWVGARDYCAEVHAGGRSYIVRESLAALAERLGPERFLRVHRAAIVNLARATEIRRGVGGRITLILADGTRVPVSRSRRALVQARFRAL